MSMPNNIHKVSQTHFLSHHYSWYVKKSFSPQKLFLLGGCKTWTLDSGLDCGLDSGLEFGLTMAGVLAFIDISGSIKGPRYGWLDAKKQEKLIWSEERLLLWLTRVPRSAKCFEI